jgi:hypothetical protein
LNDPDVNLEMLLKYTFRIPGERVEFEFTWGSLPALMKIPIEPFGSTGIPE